MRGIRGIKVIKMTLYEIFTYLKMIPPSIMELGIVIIVLSIVEVTPTIKLNPWQWLRSFAELPKRLAELEKKVDMNELFHWRSMILSRADHVRAGSKLSKERWNHTIETIDDYERACKNLEEKYGKEFQNGKAKAAIHYLKKKHEFVYENNDYLVGEDYMEEELA